MPDLNLLRAVGDQVQPPALDLLRETARRRNRRAAAYAAVACAAVVAVVIGSGVLLAGGVGEDSAPPPAATTTPTDTSTPARVDVRTLPLPKRFGDSTDLDAGRYAVRLQDLPRELNPGGVLLDFEMDVPGGWKVTKPLIRMPYPVRPEFSPTKSSGGLGRLSIQHVTDGVVVEANPCRFTSGDGSRPTSADIAGMIARLPKVDVSTPVETTLGGVDALALTIKVSPDADLTRCHDDAYILYSGGDLGASLFESVRADQPGDEVRLWIVEVASERFIFSVEIPPDATQADTDTLTRMVESIRFRE